MRRLAYIPAADADYLEFLNAGGAPTRIASESDLREVPLDRGLPLLVSDARTLLKAQIDAAAEQVRLRFITPGSVQATVTTIDGLSAAYSFLTGYRISP